MADPIRGKLVWQGTEDKRVRRIIYPTKKGMSQPTPFDTEHLSASLRHETHQTRSRWTSSCKEASQSNSPRRRGVHTAARPQQQPVNAAKPRRPPAAGRRWAAWPAQAGRGPPERGPPAAAAGVPQPVQLRSDVAADTTSCDRSNHADLGDQPPAGHHRYHPGLVSGVIRVTMTLRSPLLLPDAVAPACAEPTLRTRTHKMFPGAPGRRRQATCRRRASRECSAARTRQDELTAGGVAAVTNSRLAVFAGHADRLADRMPAREALPWCRRVSCTSAARRRSSCCPATRGLAARASR